MDYASLRRRNKQVLVNQAFSLFVNPSENLGTTKDLWVERLINGYDFECFIRELKEKTNAPALKHIVETSAQLGRLRIIDDDVSLTAGSAGKIQVKIRNLSDEIWITTDAHPLFFAYHWHNEEGSVYEFDGIRTPLSQPINPGEEATQTIDVNAPVIPGNYLLIPTLIIEGVAWLEDRGLDIHEYPTKVSEQEGFGMTERACHIYNRLKNGFGRDISGIENSKRTIECAL